eukprot:NODE_998_length_2754_cov_0.540113.p1 type:complete len:235 gc:universal NODE_998_length_2754_cov_0.540113:2303-1599(-)
MPIKIAQDLKLPISKSSHSSSTLVNGQGIKIFGEVSANVCFDLIPLRIKFLVIDTGNEKSIIIGRDRMFEFQIRIDFDSEFVWVKGHPIRINRSDDESAIYTNVISYIYSKRPNPFEFQHLQKDSSHEYDDIIVPEYKDSNNTPEHLNINPELAEDQRTALLRMASKFLTIFGKETTSRVKIRHHIRTEVTKPVRAGIPRLSQSKLALSRKKYKRCWKTELSNRQIQIGEQQWC